MLSSNRSHSLSHSFSSFSSFSLTLLSIILILYNPITLINAYTPFTSCTSPSQYYNILTLQCTSCPTSTQMSSDKTFCNCTSSFQPNWNAIGFNHKDSCKALATAFNKATQILRLYDQNGLVTSTPVTCSATSYGSKNENRCVSCGYDDAHTYSSILSACQCSSGYTRIGQACYQNKISWTRVFNTGDPFNFLAQQNVKIGCQQQNLPQSCNMLINLCVKAQYISSNFYCSLLSSLSSGAKTSLPSYKFSSVLTDSIGIYASSILNVNTTTVKNQLNIITVQYDVYGAIKQITPIDKDLFQCPVTDQDAAKFTSFGLNIYKYCATQKTFMKQSYYDFFVQTSDGKFAEIPILISGTYYKRLAPSQASGSHSFSLQFISQPPLSVPILSFKSQSSPSISTSSKSSQNTIVWTIPFIIFMVATFVAFIMLFYRYMQYNPNDDPNDPYILCRGIIVLLIKMFYTWTYALWIFLLCLSLYVFTFYKFQQTIYLIVPSQPQQWKAYYQPFLAIFYTCLGICTLSVWNKIYNLGEVDYFLIDWEKQKQIGKFEVNNQKKGISVWRRVLLVNQLYELAVGTNISIYLVTLFSLLFLKGLEWINLSFEVPNTANLFGLESITLSYRNPILTYFIITFIFFIIANIQFLLRHAVRIWYPLPAENFVDLCAITNISILIFDEYLHGYYIHGMNPLGQSQGNLQYIENIFQKQAKSYGKSRGFIRQDQDACQTFEVIFPMALRRGFQSKYKIHLLQKMIQQQQSFIPNPLPDTWNENDYNQIQTLSLNMVQNLKMYLQTIKTSMKNVLDRTWWNKFISWPFGQEVVGNIPIFLKDKWNDYTNAFLSGHQYLFLINYINWINMFYLAAGNIYFATLIAIIVHEILFKLPATFLIKRNISKNTLIDEKFFN